MFKKNLKLICTAIELVRGAGDGIGHAGSDAAVPNPE
jgi:hypothetical protein